jgi:hypothetical protein
LVKGSISFKECEEAKASPYGSNRLNEKIKDLKKEAVILLMAQKCVTRNLWASRVTASGEVRHQYRTTKFASVFTGEAMAV